MITKSKVFLMCGPAGSGKSYLAKKFESIGMIKLDFDEESFKRGIVEHPLPSQTHNEIKNYLDEKLISLICDGKDVILDYSFWSKEMRKEYIDILKTFDINPVIFYIECPKEIALDRISKRKGLHINDIQLDPKTAESYYDNFQKPTEDEGTIVIVRGF